MFMNTRCVFHDFCNVFLRGAACLSGVHHILLKIVAEAVLEGLKLLLLFPKTGPDQRRRASRTIVKVTCRVRVTNSSSLVRNSRKIHIKLPGKGNSNSHDAKPVYSNYLDDEVDSDQ